MRKLIILSNFFILNLISLVSADAGDEFGCFGGFTGGMMGDSFGYGARLFGWTLNILIIIVLVLLIVWLIKKINKK